MLQQTQVSRVEPKFTALLERWPSPCALADAPTGDLLELWRGLGYPRRALALQRSAAVICTDHDGRVPERLEDLLALPGIGPYTARAVLAFAYGQRHAVIDTNVRRVIARAVEGVERRTTVPRDHEALVVHLPDSPAEASETAAGLMELGALVCTARSPDCGACPLAERCAWRAAGYPASDAPVRRQARFEGSERQARGMLLSALLDAGGELPRSSLAEVVTDARFAPALAGLVKDGLVAQRGDGFALPD